MPLSSKQIAEMVQRYDGGEGDDVDALATAYATTPAAVRYQLKKAGAYKTEGETAAASTDQDASGESDAADGLAEILRNPALQKLIDQAVSARLEQLTAGKAAPAAVAGDTSMSIVKAIERMLEVQALQQPGYIKPISVHEVDRRAAGHVEMLAQIESAKSRYAATNSKDYIPHYILGSNFYECTAAILYAEGSEIRTFIEPGESFVPMNEPARLIHAGMITSIGGPSPEIGARIAAAMIAAKETEVPIIGGISPANSANAVEVVPSSKRHDVKPQRVLGSISPETRGTTMPVQPGITQQPAGPVFVG